MRLLGIDYGSKRVGVAVSDPGRQFAIPVTVIQNTELLISEIQKICLDHQVTEIILGESKDYKGQANAILPDSLIFKEKLEKVGYKVHLEPEFMTSFQAERLQGKIDKLDASAAALILQAYLDKLPKA